MEMDNSIREEQWPAGCWGLTTSKIDQFLPVPYRSCLPNLQRHLIRVYSNHGNLTHQRGPSPRWLILTSLQCQVSSWTHQFFTIAPLESSPNQFMTVDRQGLFKKFIGKLRPVNLLPWQCNSLTCARVFDIIVWDLNGRPYHPCYYL